MLLSLLTFGRERYIALKADEKIKYVFIFENRGEVVGVTMPHPHGQIYGYPFIPKKIALEMENSKKYEAEHGRCMFCDMLADEMKYGDRVIIENDDFRCFFCRLSRNIPTEMHTTSKQHKQPLDQFNDSEKRNLAKIVREVAGTLDSLFDSTFPYMMCMQNAPVNSAMWITSTSRFSLLRP